MQNRLSSPALWIAVAALVSFCVKEFLGLEIDSTLSGFLDVLLPALVGFGILNNPTDKNNF